MTTLASLVADYGKYVDRDLIEAIWAENSQDEAKCRNIIHMLSGQPNPENHTPVTPATSEETWTTHSDVFSQGTSSSSSKPSTRNPRPASLYPSGSEVSGDLNHDMDAITSSKTLVEFLAACFPECGRDYLETKIRDIFIAQGTGDSLQVDPIEAIDIISNSLYNDMEEVETQMYRQKNSIDASSTSNSQNSKSDGLNGPLAYSTSLADIEAKYNVEPQVNTRRGKGKSQKSKGGRANGSSGYTNSGLSDSTSGAENAWKEINRELDQLCALFPMLSAGSVRSTYHKCGADLDSAILQLSALAETHQKPRPRTGADILGKKTKAKRPPSASTIARVVQSLHEMFPDQDVELLQQAAQSDADISAAAEKVLTLISQSEVSEATKDARKKGTRWHRADQLANHKVVSSATSASRGRDQLADKQVHDMFTRIPLADLAGDARNWVSERDVDPAYCRKKAEEFIEKRNEMYAKAVQSYARRNSQRNHSGTALYYSTEGHKYDASARVWRMRAAQATVAVAKRNDASVVDLHGLSRAEAVPLALEEVNSWYVGLREEQSRRPTRTIQPLHIVTGLGNRSANGKPLVHPAVVRALRDQGWWFEENAGYINVYGFK
ncbi:hypothetical protein LPJ56_000709 [Coemansia sp. RSA 2599]|nr:hypothetical protein LPJ75_000371 [Coemansia sp. RSA 2598]KAJ1829018.1 hypothetical protein LPJ56_000709 [Coemansia sp. RSA 2599]